MAGVIPKLAMPTDDPPTMFCVNCGCGIASHRADLDALGRGESIFNCRNCGKRCRKKKGQKSLWFRNEVRARSTREPFEGEKL